MPYLIVGGSVPFTGHRCWITPRWTHSYSMDFFRECTFFYWDQEIWCCLRICCWVFFNETEKWKLFAFQPFWESTERKGSHGHYAFYQASLWCTGVLHDHCICHCCGSAFSVQYSFDFMFWPFSSIQRVLQPAMEGKYSRILERSQRIIGWDREHHSSTSEIFLLLVNWSSFLEPVHPSSLVNLVCQYSLSCHIIRSNTQACSHMLSHMLMI